MLKRAPADAPFVARRVEMVIGASPFGASPGAAEEAARLLADLGMEGRVHAPEPAEIANSLRRAAEAGPDVLAVLGGDADVRAAVQLCGADGPAVAPLPGGPSNVLARALYGSCDWPDALRLALGRGRARLVDGGEIDGRVFLAAAVLGAPALGPAASRPRRPRSAHWRAVRRALTGRLRFCLDSCERGKAEALALVGPLVSQGRGDGADGFEAVSLNAAGAARAFDLGLPAALEAVRSNAAERFDRPRGVKVWAAGHIPALLDGEPVRLEHVAHACIRRQAARLLMPPGRGDGERATARGEPPPFSNQAGTAAG
ncbi:diacylglycerol kinase family protein [Phenylobacterium sp.]|uniref:diacylglycerol/lipid kinase family protein n=1 Tax=Phenylobacterium sp. TaxID=1871053 RepID=UPI0035AEC9C2